MILDYSNNQIVVCEEGKEKFLNVCDQTKFVFCERIRNGRFEVPLVSYPILRSAIFSAGYTIRQTENLKAELRQLTKRRNALLRLRTSLEGIDHPQVIKIVTMAQEIAKEHGFVLTQEQLETVVYGVIGRSVLIGNEIGTGKTLTVNTIAKILLRLGYISKIIVLVPAVLVDNFTKDYIKFFGKEGIVSVQGEVKEKRIDLYRKFYQNPNIHFLVTNYEKCYYDFDILVKLKIQMVCVDEFHNMKNFLNAKRSINFFKLLKEQWNPKYRFPMTGTPIENSLFDLFPTFKLLDDGNILGGHRFFENNFVIYQPNYIKNPKTKRMMLVGQKAIGFKNAKYLKDLIRPYIIRKSLKLPVDLYTNYVPLDLPQTYRKKIEEIISGVSGGSARYHAIRQFLNDTSREGLTTNIKHDAVLDIISQTSEKVVIFSFYKCTLRSLAPYLKSKGYGVMTYDGEETKIKPTEMIEMFEKSDAKCLIVTDRLNYGVNIQFARMVIQYDLPMKPTIFFQRSGRCYRTGQTKDVHVYSLYFNDSVEEIIKENLEAKEEVLREVFFKLDDNEKEKKLDEIGEEENIFEQKIYKMLEKAA